MAQVINFYKTSDGLWVVNSTIRTPGTLTMQVRNEDRVVLYENLRTTQILFNGSPTNVLDEQGMGRATADELLEQVGDFFSLEDE